MKIFKFGGASIRDAQNMQNVVSIIKNYQSEIGLIVISALGKTTNKLEKVVTEFYNHNLQNAAQLLEELKTEHLQLAKGLNLSEMVLAELADMFVDVEWVLDGSPERDFDYYYDQIVCLGELLSTKIVAELLLINNIENMWVDVRDLIRTDDNYRAANVQWAETNLLIQLKIKPLFGKKLVVTQGFVGSTNDNCATTLAREGSDYSAAIFAYCLDAEEMQIWKDVDGVLTADPRLFADAILLPRLSYQEAIEMTYYGAQVIHPKTLQPLQAKNIPLRVRSFINQNTNGSIIHHSEEIDNLKFPTIIVFKANQCLLHLQSLDMEFIDEQKLSEIFNLLSKLKLKTNMCQHSALGFWAAVNDEPNKLAQLNSLLPAYFKLEIVPELQLLTLRHCPANLVDKYINNKPVFLQDSNKTTQQFLIK